jgi:hypothetical protein
MHFKKKVAKKKLEMICGVVSNEFREIIIIYFLR